VVASLSLHHIENLREALDKIADVLRTGGSLVVVEYAWDRIDEATAEWALERLPAASLSEKPSWLGRRCQEWARGGRGGDRARAASYFAEWAGEEGFHSFRRMRDELGNRLVERLFEWVPYLYPDLGEDTVEADESAAIEARSINATLTVANRSFGGWLWGSILLGLGTAMVYPSLIATLSDNSHPSWRARSLSVYRFWRDPGYAVGALCAGIIADTLGLSWAIGSVGVITLLSGVVVAMFLGEKE
jgi:hypothetical protein